MGNWDEWESTDWHLCGTAVHRLESGKFRFGGITSVAFPEGWVFEPYPNCDLCAEEVIWNDKEG